MGGHIALRATDYSNYKDLVYALGERRYVTYFHDEGASGFVTVSITTEGDGLTRTVTHVHSTGRPVAFDTDFPDAQSVSGSILVQSGTAVF